MDTRKESFSDTDEPSEESRVTDNLKTCCGYPDMCLYVLLMLMMVM